MASSSTTITFTRGSARSFDNASWMVPCAVATETAARIAQEGWESWLDPEGRVRWVDPRVKEILGLDAHDVLAEPDYPARFVRSEARASVREALAAVVAGADIKVVDTAIVCPRDTVTRATLRFQRVAGADGEPIGILLAVRLGRPDQVEFLRQVIDLDPNFVFVKDREGCFVLANKALADAYGTTVENVEGKTDADFSPNADEVAFFRKKDLAVIEENIEVAIPEERITDSTGRVRWLMTVKRPMLGEDGRPKYLLGIAADITQRREAEKERRRLDQKLQETQKLESLGLMAGGIAHDFNNLLAAILGNTSLALRRVPAGSSVTELLEQVAMAAKRAAELCRQMLAYAGRGRVDVADVDLSALVRDTTQLLEAPVSSKQAKLVLRLSPNLPLVTIDATQIRQVVMNLVLNAAEAIGDRSGTIEVTTDLASPPPDAAPAIGVTPGYLMLRVTDDGDGMSADTMARIFDPFFTAKFTGRGLGLAAVRGIVQSHGGALDVTSELGRGSTFRMWLPISVGAAAEPAVQPPARCHPEPGGWVLVVDDEANVRDVTSSMLTEFGYRVVAVESGEAAVACLRAEPARFDVVLCDVMMPGLSGSDTIRALRALRPQLHIVLMSGFLATDSTIELDASDYAGFLEKPFDLVLLRTALGRDELV